MRGPVSKEKLKIESQSEVCEKESRKESKNNQAKVKKQRSRLKVLNKLQEII